MPEWQYQTLLSCNGHLRDIRTTDVGGLIAGRRDPGWLADFARTTMRRRKPELESALEGTLNEHPRRLLAAQLRHLDWCQSEVAAVQRHLLRQMEPYQAQVQRLNSIPGVEELTASTIAELGDDCAAFPRDDKVAIGWACVQATR